METLFDPQARARLVARLQLLTPESRATWGRLTAPKMICHLADSIRLALGEITGSAPAGPLRFFPLNRIAIYWMPWPKGKVEAPRELMVTDVSTWDADMASLLELVDRLAANGPDGEWPATSPAFGTMRGRDWAVLNYRHLDHHLTQFGL